MFLLKNPGTIGLIVKIWMQTIEKKQPTILFSIV